MRATGTLHKTRHHRVHGSAHPHLNPHARTAVPPARPFPGPLSTAPISIAGGDWTPDLARAERDAKAALSLIDWSKHDLVIWVPGTSNHTIQPEFVTAMNTGWDAAARSLSLMDYSATWEMRPSTATGLATLKLVLAGIAAHNQTAVGGVHRVMLCGESQGAWIIGEAMADPMLRSVVTRAVLMGHPFLAAHHYDDGHDAGMLEVNNRGDQVAAPIVGNLSNALDAMIAIHQAQWNKFPLVAKVMIDNPSQLWLTLLWAFRSTIGKKFTKDPHVYTDHMPAFVQFLKTGS